MTHEELLAKIHEEDNSIALFVGARTSLASALHAVVELHKPKGELDWAECDLCDVSYPCTTIQAIEAELR